MWVVKLGGAMMQAPELRHWLEACGERNSGTACVFAPGGGDLADQIRSLQVIWQFDDSVAHALAIDAMRINARVLKTLAPAAVLSGDFAAMTHAINNGDVTVWLPAPGLTIDGVPDSWAVTSDSLALHVAQRLRADGLLLVKSVDPGLLSDDSAPACARDGLIDEYFPQLLAGNPVPTRVVSKYQHAEFADAVRRGELFGARVGP